MGLKDKMCVFPRRLDALHSADRILEGSRGFIATEGTGVPFLSVERSVSNNKQNMCSFVVFVGDVWMQVEDPLPYLEFSISICLIAARLY